MKTTPSDAAKPTDSKKTVRSRKTIKTARARARTADPIPTAAGRENPADSAAFIPDPEATHRRVPDDLAEYLGEGFIQSVTGGDDEPGGVDAVSPEELGGPFVETDAVTEYARDASSEADDEDDDQTVPEAFPTAIRAGGEPGRTTEAATLLESTALDEGDEEGQVEAADDADEDADENEDDKDDELEELAQASAARSDKHRP